MSKPRIKIVITYEDGGVTEMGLEEGAEFHAWREISRGQPTENGFASTEPGPAHIEVKGTLKE